ncbi:MULTISPECIES: NAD(P)/FAD-dependent oxidoreductase [Paenibacillus]|uniref:Ferredoxin--NADP reductase n=1 Tax=Paenibacillus azoreducens TaxID=116718 RepID=A0A919YLG8_9BACL|nr:MULTISPECIES: NAD(P)/FAD-dependent oxidoreductase [Paenibacillus]MBE9916341.1 NAD(P)/FAD-dependent oxidoreductase [Paenibacillus donghaensis]GIO51575.1 ferredoxin--NADP reductase 1 [Paenibacillus azoreducens]
MQKEMNPCYDVTIIGGGPTGLFAAFYAGMRDMKTKVIEAAPYLGGKLPYYREKFLYDIGGIEAITAEDLTKELEAQARTFDPTIVLSQLIETMERLDDGTFRLTSQTGEVHLTHTVLVAAGGGTLVAEKLDLPNARQYEGRHLHYKAESLEQFRNKRVLISGGGDSAVDWAIALASIAESVTIVHRRDEFRAHEGNVAQMRNTSVHIMTSSLLCGIHGDQERIYEVTIEHFDSGEISVLEIDEILVCHGVKPDLGEIKHWGLKIERGRVIVDAWMQTSIPGIFAAGDVAEYPGKLPGLIAGGFMEGPAAINRAKAYLEPYEDIKPIWSTGHPKLMAIHGES